MSWLREQGYAMAVATGKGRRGLDRALIETGFKRFFDATRCADETHSKPHPRMLLEIMEELAVSAEQTLMVGDTEYDMEMAHNAGAARVAVCYGVHEAERLLRWSPLACVERIDALKEILARLPLGGSAQATR